MTHLIAGAIYLAIYRVPWPETSSRYPRLCWVADTMILIAGVAEIAVGVAMRVR